MKTRISDLIGILENIKDIYGDRPVVVDKYHKFSEVVNYEGVTENIDLVIEYSIIIEFTGDPLDASRLKISHRRD